MKVKIDRTKTNGVEIILSIELKVLKQEKQEVGDDVSVCFEHPPWSQHPAKFNCLKSV